MQRGLCVGAALAACIGWSVAASAGDMSLRLFGGATLGNSEVTAEYALDLEDLPPIGVFPVPGPQSVDLDLDTGFVGGAAIGSDVWKIRLEGELAYRKSSADLATTDLDISVVSLLANAWYRAPLPGRLVGYAGGGLGVAQGRVDGLGEQIDGEGDPGFAWQLGAGIERKLGARTTLGVGYRYFAVPKLYEDSRESDIYVIRTKGDYRDSSVIAEIGRSF